MGKGIDRTQILRMDCTACRGRGYSFLSTGQEADCLSCGGSGMMEKEVSYKFDTGGVWTDEEKAEAFGIDPSEFKDKGHSSGDEAA